MFDKYSNRGLIRSSTLKEINENGHVLGTYDPLNSHLMVSEEDYSILTNFELLDERSHTLLHELAHVSQIHNTTSGLMYTSINAIQGLHVPGLLEHSPSLPTSKPFMAELYNSEKTSFKAGPYNVQSRGVEQGSKNVNVLSTILSPFQQLEDAQFFLDQPRTYTAELKTMWQKFDNSSVRQNYGNASFALPDAAYGISYYFLLSNFLFYSRFEGAEILKEDQLTEATSRLYNEEGGRNLFRKLVSSEFKFDLYEIHESQARLIEIQFIALKNEEKQSFEYFRDMGFLSGPYFNPFRRFLKIANLTMPLEVLDWRATLYNIACDLAMNPSLGFATPPIDFGWGEIKQIHPCSRLETVALALVSNRNLVKEIKNTLASDGLPSPFAHMSVMEALSEAAFPNELSFSEAIHYFDRLADCIVESIERGSAVITPVVTLDRIIGDFLQRNRFRASHSDMHITPLHIATDYPQLLPQILPIAAKSTNGDWSFFSHPVVGVDQSAENMGESYLIAYYAGQIYSDLMRQFVLRPGEFSMEYEWLPEPFRQLSCELARRIFEAKLGCPMSSIKVN